METSEWLGMRSKREYLGKMRWRYRRAQGRGYKSRLIEELVAVCGYSRKHAISLLNGRGGPGVLKRTEPKPTYQEEVSVVLKRIWFASDQLCGKRLKAALPHWLPHYQRSDDRSATGAGASQDAAQRSWWDQAGSLAQEPDPAANRPMG